MVTHYSLPALGQVVRQLRKDLGLTQDELGSAAGYAKGAGVAISRIENGRLAPSVDRFQGLAAALRVSTGELTRRAATATPKDAPSSGGLEVSDELARRSKIAGERARAFIAASDRSRVQFLEPLLTERGRISGAPEDSEAPASNRRGRPELSPMGIEAQMDMERTGQAVRKALSSGTSTVPTFLFAVITGISTSINASQKLSPAAKANALKRATGPGALGLVNGGVAATGLVLPLVSLAGLTGAAVGPLARSRSRREEAQREAARLRAALERTRFGFDATTTLLDGATEALNYVAIHAGHAVRRWVQTLPAGSIEWASLTANQKTQYHVFEAVAEAEFALHTIDFQTPLEDPDDEPDRIEALESNVEYSRRTLEQARRSIEELV